MAHFARLNSQDIVEFVTVVNNDVLMKDGKEVEQLGVEHLQKVLGGGMWKQTSYNGNFRKNYAGVGMTYNIVKDAFYISDCGYPSWVFDEETCRWNAPVAYPDDGKSYAWDEENIEWKENNPE